MRAPAIVCDGCNAITAAPGRAHETAVPAGWFRLVVTTARRRSVVVEACSPMCAARALDMVDDTTPERLLELVTDG